MRAGLWQIVLVIILVLILFGHNKIPDMMKNLASGINVFKKELKDDKKSAPDADTTKKPAAAKKSAHTTGKKSPAKRSAKKAVKK